MRHNEKEKILFKDIRLKKNYLSTIANNPHYKSKNEFFNKLLFYYDCIQFGFYYKIISGQLIKNVVNL